MEYSDSSSEWSEDDSLATCSQPQETDASQPPHKGLDGLALHGFVLGILLTAAATVTAWFFLQPPLSPQCRAPHSPHWRTPFFLASIASLHALELWAITRYAPEQASSKHLRLGAGRRTHIVAYTFATVECLVSRYLWWFPFGLPFVMEVAGTMVVVGLLVHTLAIVHAGPAFLDEVRRRTGSTSRTRPHALVTTGIYRVMRHPAYFGYFWWAIGTQLIMGNVLSLLAFPIVLWSFFAGRVRVEEEMLVRVYGLEYEDYQRRVGTWMPFIGNT
ncbi:Isoprenylcysteine carboxyl methyltransferase family-domain-containing protein [Microdochium bolleyi]|uniref:Protein-S-isoprenylcysteine O-methyltransferase n=1 Tax=Microdochium bolleyi TaxID=196109 RepID=A0A136IR57_9PEZI|nr:Isoprenylcysteine carboxyl methyltransferase family-domain-containing protein [Microdochium bolleyi]